MKNIQFVLIRKDLKKSTKDIQKIYIRFNDAATCNSETAKMYGIHTM